MKILKKLFTKNKSLYAIMTKAYRVDTYYLHVDEKFKVEFINSMEEPVVFVNEILTSIPKNYCKIVEC